MPLIRKPAEGAPQVAAAPPDAPRDGLGSASPEMRWAAARDAAGRPESVPALAEALARESDARVREAIFTALSRIATPESVTVVLPYVRSDDAVLRTGALDALRAMPDAIAAHLPRLLADTDADVRLLACDLARVSAGREAPRILCALIETDPEPNVCAAAVEVLAEIGDADAVASLGRCAQRFPDDPFLAFAIKAASDRLSGRNDRA